MIITYDARLVANTVVAAVVKERMAGLEDLFPDWVQTLIIFYETDNPEGATLSCHPNYHYRFAQIQIYPEFLDDPSWKKSLLHEIIHIYKAPYNTKVDTILEKFVEDRGLLEYLLLELRQEDESVVQDIANMLMKFDK